MYEIRRAISVYRQERSCPPCSHHIARHRGLGVLHRPAQRLAPNIIPPVEIAQIDKPKDVDKPPPPPPKLEEIKPYVSAPEFVDIQAPQEQTNAIQTVHTTQPVAPAAVVAAPVEHHAVHQCGSGSEAPAEDR